MGAFLVVFSAGLVIPRTVINYPAREKYYPHGHK